MELEIIEDIIFIYDEKGEQIYNIHKRELGDTINLNGNNISAWINQLLEKMWIEYDILYLLASVIQEEFPENSIDWYHTFSIVERQYYLQHVKNLEDNNSITDGANNKVFGTLLDHINSGIEAQDDNTDNLIDKILVDKLAKYNLG